MMKCKTESKYYGLDATGRVSVKKQYLDPFYLLFE